MTTEAWTVEHQPGQPHGFDWMLVMGDESDFTMFDAEEVAEGIASEHNDQLQAATAAEREAFRGALKPIQDRMCRSGNANLADQINAAIKSLEPRHREGPRHPIDCICGGTGQVSTNDPGCPDGLNDCTSYKRVRP